MAAAAEDCAFAAQFSAVAIKGSDTGQSSDFSAVELTKLRHLGQERCRGARTHSADCSQFVCFGRELLRPGDVLVNEQIRWICFWICLFKLRFNFRTEESPKRAPRFCSMTSKRLKCRR